MPIDPLAPFRLDGRVVIVTGASSGIGERFARVLHAAGAQVVAAARRADRLEVLSKECDGLLPVSVDLALSDDRERLVETVIGHFGRVDVLVNNAGIGDTYPAQDEPLDHWSRVVEVNQTAVFHLSQLCGRQMLEQGSGVVVNVASILGLVASGQIPQVSYAASKGAVVNMTRELAVQWARRGIRVNAIAPGWFLSEMTQEMFDDEGGRSFIRRNTPMGRPGELAELDGALLYLASDASTYTTGAILAVDGGWIAR
ncbi:MAG TPA: SDR family oxidoreductase [Acidimicrobiales bacterium]|nr:SDR family oxidoreductase [Acidimicrobiales bacterium]